MPNNLDWLNDIDYSDLLNGDMKMIKQRCGEDVLLSLLRHLPKIHIYMSEKPLIEAKKRYIGKYYKQGNAKEIAVKLGVSERFVYEAHKEIIQSRQKEVQEENLFSSTG